VEEREKGGRESERERESVSERGVCVCVCERVLASARENAIAQEREMDTCGHTDETQEIDTRMCLIKKKTSRHTTCQASQVDTCIV
jgi:hypothetical protein